jgi:23S rRNA (uracil-5-)-methyltransferase RumA
MKLCRHFSECGGCKFQDIPYQEQLRRKESEIKEMIDFFQLDTELRPINHYQEWFYRNKMEFTFAYDTEQNLICGLHKRQETRRVLDVKECLIFSPWIELILDTFKDFLRGKYPAYNKFTHQGFLRHLVVREAKFTNQIMIGIVTTSKMNLDQKGFLERILSLKFSPQIKSVYWIINDRVSDAVVFEKKELLYGEPFITEQLDDFNFRIFIDSFFQTNPFGIRDLYQKIVDYANLRGVEQVLDLYCGVGPIGLFLAKKAKFVWGVEVKREVVDNAFINAEINNVQNISFICEDVKRFLAKRCISEIDVMVINPPRCGLSKKIKRYILEVAPPLIFYSSCNPQTLFIDLRDLSGRYKVKFIEPFDFFPHTPHLECLAVLNR